MASHALLDEILALPETERFEATDVSSIVTKHIPLGTERTLAIDYLSAKGFKVKEDKQSISQCPDCDELTVVADYSKESIPFSPYRYQSIIAIQLGFKQGRVAFVSGRYAKNSY